MESRSSALFVILLFLAGAAAVLLAFEERVQPPPDASESFQRLVGGLGFGPALDLSECAFAFDPRLDGSGAEERGPIPGGACFHPRHAGSLFDYPPLEHGVEWLGEGDGDGSAP